jgi:CheY-like chemotaxis protein
MTIEEPKTPVTILLAEDDPEDRYLIGEALYECRIDHVLQVVEDGDDLLDYLFRRGDYSDPSTSPRPGLIILDLNMPRKDGREALEQIKADRELRRIPIVVLTQSRSEEDILSSYDLGVSGYITKPVSFMGLLNAIKAIGAYWLQIASLPPTD